MFLSSSFNGFIVSVALLSAEDAALSEAQRPISPDLFQDELRGVMLIDQLNCTTTRTYTNATLRVVSTTTTTSYAL